MHTVTQAIPHFTPLARPSFQCAQTTAMEIEIVNPLTDRSWDVDVAKHPAATSFHTSEWAQVLHSSYGHVPCYMRAMRGGELLALVPLMQVKTSLTPRRGICLPFSDFCGPLLFQRNSGRDVMDAVRCLGHERKWRYLEIRDSALSDNGQPESATYFGHELDLRGGQENIFSRFADSVQRAVRKAQRHGLSVEISQSQAAMQGFLKLHAQTRCRHGVPPQPDAFFEAIRAQMLEKGGGFIATAHQREIPLAAAMFFRYRTHAIYKFSASNNDFQGLRPNNLVIWRAIEHLTSSNVQTLHFGRTDISDSGLRRFKAAWGVTESTLRYYKFDLRAAEWLSRPLRSGSNLGNHLFRALPAGLNRLAGTLLYPHLD